MEPEPFKERQTRIKAFIAKHYLEASDSVLALKLGTTAGAIRKIRKRLGLEKSFEDKKRLCFKSMKRRGWSGGTNEYGDPVDACGIPLPRNDIGRV